MKRWRNMALALEAPEIFLETACSTKTWKRSLHPCIRNRLPYSSLHVTWQMTPPCSLWLALYLVNPNLHKFLSVKILLVLNLRGPFFIIYKDATYFRMQATMLPWFKEYVIAECPNTFFDIMIPGIWKLSWNKWTRKLPKLSLLKQSIRWRVLCAHLTNFVMLLISTEL